MVTTLPNFYIRKATLEDLKYVHHATDIFNAAYGVNNHGWASVKKIVNNYHTTKEEMENYIRESVAGNLIQLFLFERDTQGNDKAVAGTLTIESKCGCSDGDLPEGDGMLGRFSIDLSHHSKGLGKKLLQVGLDEMKKANYSVCSILVFENRTELIEWYKKLGFVDTMERSPFHPPDGATILNNVPFALLKMKL
ncbi:acyl-CoA N-acyltransferase [Parasitella parasitica]|nr:acyl-CoA N-acyltransferase [Parasitella parasitica]